MHRLFYIVLLGGLVLASVYAEVDSTRESLERSTIGDQSQMGDNEKVIPQQNLPPIESFSHSPVNVRSLKPGRVILPPIDSGAQVPNVIGSSTESRNSEERDDSSSESHNPIQLKTHMVSPVNQREAVDPAAQVVKETPSSGEINARIRSGVIKARIRSGEIKEKIRSSVQGQRIIAANYLLRNRSSRGKTTTATNPISEHSDEENDDLDKKTTTARNVPTRDRIRGFHITTTRSSTTRVQESAEQDAPVEKIEAMTMNPIQTTTIRKSISRNGSDRLRSTTELAPISSTSDEDSSLTTAAKTARSFTFGNRFNRVRTTTVPTSDVFSEEVESVSSFPATTARSLVWAKLFGRKRTTTAVSRNSNENDDAVKEIGTTTVLNSVIKNRTNRFETTTSSKPVTQESEEQVNVITTTQMRTTTAIVPISDTSDEVDDSANVTETTTLRTLISGSRLSRFRTTVSAPLSKKSLEDQDETASATTATTTRTSSFRNRFNPKRTPTSPRISRDSIEEEDFTKGTLTTTARNLPSRFRFGLTGRTTIPAAISANSDEDNDFVNKTETQRRFLARNRFGVLRTTSTPGSTDSEEQVSLVKKTQAAVRNSILRNRSGRLQTAPTSIPTVQNSTERIDSGNGSQTSSNTSSHIAIPVTISSDSDERDDMSNGAGTTTARTRVTLRYFNRYRTTTDHKLPSANSDEQVHRSVATTRMTSNVQIPSITDRPPFTPSPDKVTSSPEIANLGRKDRAIIYTTKTNIDVKHLNDFQTEAPAPVRGYFTAQQSDETDDVSDDEDVSSLPYPFIQYRRPTTVPLATILEEEDSDEVEEFSLESQDTITDKLEESAEISKDGMIVMMVPNSADIFTPKKSAESSLEIIFFVFNNSESIQNQTATLLRRAKLLIGSDEGNDASDEGNDASDEGDDASDEGNDASEESEGSGAVPDDNVQSQTTPVHSRILGSEERNDGSTESQLPGKVMHLDVQNPNDSVEQSVYESKERSDISTEIKVSNRVLTGDIKGENQTESDEKDVITVTESSEVNTISAESGANKGSGDIRQNRNQTSEEVARDSEENDDTSLEVDVIKLTEIEKLLTDAENDGVSPDVEDRAAAPVNENHAIFPDIDSLMKLDVTNHTKSTATDIKETLMKDANNKNEVNMKIRKLLTNPIVQQRLQERLQAIDGRLIDSKSARVKRLIEKYLAALAKLSPSSNSATSISFSVFFTLIITCLLLAFS